MPREPHEVIINRNNIVTLVVGTRPVMLVWKSVTSSSIVSDTA